MSRTYVALLALCFNAALAIFFLVPRAADAQGLDPRAAQAMAICNSPAGALITECQQLKGLAVMGAVPGVQGVPGAGASSPQAAAAAQQIYAACIRAAGINTVAMQQCNANLNRSLGLPQPAAGAATAFDRNTNTSINIATGGAAYQQCVAAMMASGQQAGGINPCTPLLSGNPAGPGAPAAFRGAGAAGGSDVQTQRTLAYQNCVAQLGPSMRGHECTSLISGGPPPAGFNPGGVAQANPPAPAFAGANPPAPGVGAPPPGVPADPLGGAPNKPFDPLGL